MPLIETDLCALIRNRSFSIPPSWTVFRVFSLQRLCCSAMQGPQTEEPTEWRLQRGDKSCQSRFEKVQALFSNRFSPLIGLYLEANRVTVCVDMFSDEAGFWIGKTSLRGWRQLALDQLEEDEEETKHNNSKVNGEKSSSPGNKGTDDNLKSNTCVLYLSSALFRSCHMSWVVFWYLLVFKLMEKEVMKKGTVKRWRTLMKTFFVITVSLFSLFLTGFN